MKNYLFHAGCETELNKMTFFLDDFKVTHILSCNLSGIWSELCYRKAWVENVQFSPFFGMSRDNLK